ncbi:transglutaminase-like cysteine peptidase [Shewanella sp.]|uniref:transglutaminase-like cysteine peptidase n=1 Tax=Shewanella sp. TaxID=50422 RepID=UPI003A97C522
MGWKDIQFKYIRIVLLFISVTLLLGNANYLNQLFSPEYMAEIKDRYGDEAVERIAGWKRLLDEGKGQSDWMRINNVNNFFNKNVTYQSDLVHWGQEDYWATPVETLGTGAGDCEDYAIAKYVSLRAMGVPDSKLRIMYVRALSVDEPHMVLLYIEQEDAVPKVLDNLNPKLLPATRRADLKPIYGFNAEGLWLAKAQGLGRKVEGKTGGSNWQDLLNRIEKGM